MLSRFNPPYMTAHVTDQNFETEVLQSTVPVLIDFYAEWCGPCKMMAPIIDSVAPNYEGKVKIFKMNVDENMQTTEKYGVRSIPTFIGFKGGQVVMNTPGAMAKEDFVALLDKLVSA